MIDFDSPTLDWDLADMTKAQLIGQIMHMRNQLQALEEFRDDAFEAVPNIDLYIEYAKRAKQP